MFSFAKVLATACSLAGLFGSAFGTGIIVPLYVWPGDPNVCSGWTPLFNVYAYHVFTSTSHTDIRIYSISATPSLTFYVVINPGSGPGDPNTQPVDSYSTCIQQLKAAESGSNLRVLGYVATGGGSSTTVVRDITTYSGWNAAYRPDGIFFDQGSTASSQVSTYAGWANQARQILGSSTYVSIHFLILSRRFVLMCAVDYCEPRPASSGQCILQLI